MAMIAFTAVCLVAVAWGSLRLATAISRSWRKAGKVVAEVRDPEGLDCPLSPDELAAWYRIVAAYYREVS
jgi:hypothetical protein